MKRLAFLLGAASIAWGTSARAAGRDTVILLAGDGDDGDAEYVNVLAEELRARGVSLVDPSAVTLTYHERVEVVAIAKGSVAAMAASGVSWIEAKYHASRALFVDLSFHESEMPYGEFTVDVVRAVCSFRCMDVATRAIIKAGSFSASERGEDRSATESRAANAALLAMAGSSAPALR